MRMPDRLPSRSTADAELDPSALPPMALLTLVENAVRHGIDPTEEGGAIDVGSRATTASAGGGVADSGVGLSRPTAQPAPAGQPARARWRCSWPDAAQLELAENVPRGRGRHAALASGTGDDPPR